VVIKTLCINTILSRPDFVKEIWDINCSEIDKEYIILLERYLNKNNTFNIKYILSTPEILENKKILNWAKKKKYPVLDHELPKVIDTSELDKEIIKCLSF
jgi:hypothetical protein